MNRQSFYAFSKEFRDEILNRIANFDISQLYQKESYAGDFQVVNLENIEIKQERMYKNTQPHRTNGIGEILINITDGVNYCEYTWSEFQRILDWKFAERPYRLIVPNIILSEPLVKQFIGVALQFNLPVVSTNDEQITYYTELVDGEINGYELLSTYPQIINEIRPE